MLKKTALIAMVLGTLAAPLAWAQDESDSDDEQLQASDAADESSGEDATADEMTDADDSSDKAGASETNDEGLPDLADEQDEEASKDSARHADPAQPR